MKYPCRLIVLTDSEKQQGYPNKSDVGDMWEDPSEDRLDLSPYYKQNNAKRKPLIVCLPTRVWFCVDGMAYKYPLGYHGNGWQVTGVAPLITVRPSIDICGRWHGWLEEGVLRDA